MLFDHSVAIWFHERLSHSFADVLYALSFPGSALWIAVVLGVSVSCLLWYRHWHGLALLLLTIPGGMLVGQLVKELVRRHRPFTHGWFVDWSGYSFPSGHTEGATLLYGFLAIILLRAVVHVRWKIIGFMLLSMLTLLVGFSRVALGAHYVTDVLGGMLLGLVWLGLCFGLVTAARRWFEEKREPQPVPVEIAERE